MKEIIVEKSLKMKSKKMNPENITKDKQYGINPLHDQNGKTRIKFQKKNSD